MKNWILTQISNIAPLTTIILLLTITHKWWQPYFSTSAGSQSDKTTIQQDTTDNKFFAGTKRSPRAGQSPSQGSAAPLASPRIQSQTSNEEELDSSEDDHQHGFSASNMTSQTLKPIDPRSPYGGHSVPSLLPEDLLHLPNSQLTPGAIFVGATREMICVRGYSKSVRNVPLQEKKAVYREYGIKHHKPREYEVDHLVSLELGGSNDISNLWPEPYEGELGARVKDKLEDELHHRVCAGTVPLAQAQQEIATDWVVAYKKYVGNR